MLPKKLKGMIDSAIDLARCYAHEYVTTEHVLSVILEEEEVLVLLMGCGINVMQLQTTVHSFLQYELSDVVTVSVRIPKLTLGVKRLIERSIMRAKSGGRDDNSAIDVLLEIFTERDSYSVYFLSQQNVDFLDIVSNVDHSSTQSLNQLMPYSDATPVEDAKILRYERGGFFAQASPEQPETSMIKQYCTNMNKKAQSEDFDPVIGRDQEIEKIIRSLCCRKKNNAVLVGECGVGKTAIVEGLARKIVEKKVPDLLLPYTVYALDLGAILGGTKYRGDFEERIKALIYELRERRYVMIFIDEIHSIIGAGATNGSSLDASNLLKPVLSQGKVRCIGATTYKEYNQMLLRDRAFLRRFHRVDVQIPSLKEVYQILFGVRSRYERYHQVKYTPSALKTIAEVADRCVGNSNTNMPDKAVTMMDEIGAYFTSRRKNDLSLNVKKVVQIRPKEVLQVATTILPASNMALQDVNRMKTLANLEVTLQKTIFGQNTATSVICDKLKVATLGLGNENKPLGCYLLYGPTGVGKTEFAKQVASALGVKFLRFDMSEYAESHSVSKIMGSPPGYVGFEQGGLLANAVYHAPHCVLLLDEIEKAHHAVYNMLLQVMDYGHLTESVGRVIDFRNVIIFLTTNLGSQFFDKLSIGFTDKNNHDASIKEIHGVFSPEFRNRLTAMVRFNNLTPEAMDMIVDKLLNALAERLYKQKKIRLLFAPEVRHFIINCHENQGNGVRFLEQYIDEHIASYVVEGLLKQTLSKNQVVHVQCLDKKLHFRVEDACFTASKK